MYIFFRCVLVGGGGHIRTSLPVVLSASVPLSSCLLPLYHIVCGLSFPFPVFSPLYFRINWCLPVFPLPSSPCSKGFFPNLSLPARNMSAAVDYHPNIFPLPVLSHHCTCCRISCFLVKLCGHVCERFTFPKSHCQAINPSVYIRISKPTRKSIIVVIELLSYASNLQCSKANKNTERLLNSYAVTHYNMANICMA